MRPTDFIRRWVATHETRYRYRDEEHHGGVPTEKGSQILHLLDKVDAAYDRDVRTAYERGRRGD